MEFLSGEFTPLSKRGLALRTCKKYGYATGTYKGKPVHIAPYYKGGVVVAQHLRTPDKDFPWVGESKGVELFGQHLWRQGGKRIVITEGEIDCLTIAQVFNLKWPVVSVHSGSKSAYRNIMDNLEFLEGYDEVVLAFDADEPGREAIEKCVSLFSPGKVKVMSYPEGFKDANAMLQAGLVKEISDQVFEAKGWRPDGIIAGDALWESVETPIEEGYSYPWESLTKLTFGQRMGELVALGAGTGMGKTDVFKEMALHNVHAHSQKVGLIFLEEAPAHTARCLMGKAVDKLLHIPNVECTEDERREAFEKAGLANGMVYLYDHFGSTDYEVIKAKMRYMVVSLGVRFIYLDHITALVSGDASGDERKQLDYIMTDLASLVRELKFNLHFISHLNTPEGKPHEEGGRVQIRHFRGSRGIGQWSSFMLGLERDQQAEDEGERHTSTVRLLKDRYTGRGTGKTFLLKYNQETGRLHETEAQAEDFGFTAEDGKEDF